MSRIYLSPPHLAGTELAMLTDALESNWIAPLGPHVEAFEREMAAKVELPHALALASGTAGLHLALIVLGIQQGDVVLCSTLTFAATANAIRYVGARPVFIDCDASWTMDPALLEAELDERARRGEPAKAVVVVDLYGVSADYDPIARACARHGVPVIQDAAEALGAGYRGRPAGGEGAMSVLSFNGNKIITTSGGGMLLSRNKAWIDHARKLSTQAREPAAHYEHREIGYNYRLSNLLAAVGRAQLAVLDDRVAARRRIRERYRAALGGLPGLSFLDDPAHGVGNAWLTCVTIAASAFGASREDVRLRLEAADIEARPVWKPMHLQPVFADCPIRGGSVSARLFAEGLCLPSGSSLSEADQDRVIDLVRSTASGTRA